MSYVKLTAKNSSNTTTELKCNDSGSINIDGSAVTQPISASSLPLPSGAATLTEQQTQSTSLSTIAGDTTSIDGKLPTTLGQTTKASSLSVTVASDDTVAVSDSTAQTSLSTIAGDTTSIDGKLPTTLGQTTKASSLSVTIASDDTINIDGSAVTQPISAASLPLPTGAATLTEQQTQSTSLSTIAGDTTSIDGKLPTTLGQTTKANSISVTIASDDTVAVSDSTAQTSLSSIKTDYVDRRINLQYQRSLGNCYSLALVDATGTTNNNFYLATLFNPSASGKTMYIYDLNFGANQTDLTSGTVLLQVLKLTSAPSSSNGTIKTPTNMKLSSTNTSYMDILRDVDPLTISPGDVIYNSKQTFSTTSGDMEYIEIDLNLKDDMIEIPEGYGIVLKVNRNSLQDMFSHCNIKYVEL